MACKSGDRVTALRLADDMMKAAATSSAAIRSWLDQHLPATSEPREDEVAA
jgi:hypothetical protein